MKLIEFKEQTDVVAKDQKEYLPMPAWIDKVGDEGRLICKWQLTWKERLRLLMTGTIWHHIWTFHHSVQPQLLSVEYPFQNGGRPV